MLSHTTRLVAKTNPIKYIFEKPALTGRITRWQMTLSEYDITYVSQKTIKGSALAEHLAYHPLTNPQPLLHEFPNGHIMATMGIGPQPEDEWMMWFNEASNLLGNRIEETRDAKLIPYHDHMKEIIESFDTVTIHHVPREENQMADALATLLALV
ncbi:hypothetical protein CR513_32332, partial [Mucuna pruriens]